MSPSHIKIKKDEEIFRYNVDVIIISCSLLLVGTFLNGAAALLQALCGVLSAVACEYFSFKFVTKNENSLTDLSAVSTGLIIALMLPSNAPLFVVVFASAIAILIAKMPFGVASSTPFVPACVGFCSVSVFFPQYVFTYLQKAVNSDVSQVAIQRASTFLDTLRIGESINFNLFTVFDILSGAVAGAIGTTSVLALFGGLLYILIQHPKRLISTASYILTSAVFAMLFPRVQSGIFTSVVMELCAGSLLFVAILVLNDPVTSPKKPKQAIIYGAGAAAIGMLLRYFGKIDDPACFSVLIANAIWLIFANKEKTVATVEITESAEIEQDTKEKISFKDKIKTLNLKFDKTKSNLNSGYKKDKIKAKDKNDELKAAAEKDKQMSKQD